MQILLFVAGLVLLIAGGSWFDGAATVGAILVAVSVLLTAIQLVVIARAKRALERESQRMHRSRW